MSPASTVTLSCESAGLMADLALLENAAKLSPQFRSRLLRLGDLRAEVVGLDADGLPAAGACNGRIRLQLADGFRDLALALRAADVYGHFVEAKFHG